MSAHEKLREAPILNELSALIDFARMKIGSDCRETLMILFEDTRNRLLGFQCYPGSLIRTFIDRCNAVEDALRFKASAAILVHNHSSGICEPSTEDIQLTRALQDSLALINVTLLEHLIITPRGSFSFRAHQLLVSRPEK